MHVRTATQSAFCALLDVLHLCMRPIGMLQRNPLTTPWLRAWLFSFEKQLGLLAGVAKLCERLVDSRSDSA